MKPITDLKNYGQGKDCIIIGGGNSINEFDFKKVPDSIIRIAVNFMFINTRIDYNIFSDRIYTNFLNLFGINENIKLIGFKDNIFDNLQNRCNYYYDWNSVCMGYHVGFYALQVASIIMDFNRIYLIGYDYYIENGQIHYYGNHYVCEDKIKAYKNKYMALFIQDFDKITGWSPGIYNLNRKSKLRKFQFKKRIEPAKTG